MIRRLAKAVRHLAFVALCATRLSAQPTLEQRLHRIDALTDASDVFGPGAQLAAGLAASPNSYELLWRAARDGVILSLARSERDEVNGYLRRAEALGRRAMLVNATGRDGTYWLAAVLARLAQRTSFLESMRYGREAYTLAVDLLRADSLDAGANALVGRMQLELLKLPAPIRALVTLGLPARDISWTGAYGHLTRAISLDRNSVAYRVDLVYWLLRRGEFDRADRETVLLRALPVRTAADTFFQRDIGNRVAAARAGARP